MNPPDRSAFLDLSTEAIAALVRQRGYPRVGIFVPDGNRRSVLSTTELDEDSEEFLPRVAFSQTAGGLDALKVFFSHGQPTLFAPLFSSSVLERGIDYWETVVLKTIRTMVTSDAWLEFFAAWDVRLRVYGDLSALKLPGSEQALEWIDQGQRLTRKHSSRTLFVGIGGEPRAGYGAFMAGCRFQETYGRKPSTADEMVEYLYGQPVHEADFVIFNGDMDSLGALPSLVYGKGTQVYYLLGAGAQALKQKTYRMILYDLLYMRNGRGSGGRYQLSQAEREQVRAWYAAHDEIVVGVGHRNGTIWVLDGFDRSASI